MKEIISKIVCFFIGHNYEVKETFRRIGTNEYFKVYMCKRCGHIKHIVSAKINP